ncbi:MAG: C-terminal binding protein [Elusimicrobiota bacterium]|jgi:D-3-phosphoglycerate dehydrogenase|nr:C-terminal binding protein [Elusimicrobiota bacterium]
MKIIITDCDHDSIEIEKKTAAQYGFPIEMPLQCKTEDDVIKAAKDADAIVVQYAPITKKVIDALPNLKVVGRYGVGVDSLDVPSITAKGVAVCNVPDFCISEVADQAIALALSVARGIRLLDNQIRTGHYSLEIAKPLHRISGKIFGVVGLGNIGSTTAKKARGIGYEAIGYDILYKPGTTTKDAIPTVSFDDLLSQSDIISIHTPLTAATKHLFNASVFTKMKKGAILINTSRGGLIDTQALVEALKNKTIFGAGLDVFEQEPFPKDHPLCSFNNVVLTPHAGWYSEEAYAELKRKVIENVADVISGKKPRNILNPEVLK